MWRAALHHIGGIGALRPGAGATGPYGLQHVVKQLPGCTGEGLGGGVFLLFRRIPHHHPISLGLGGGLQGAEFAARAQAAGGAGRGSVCQAIPVQRGQVRRLHRHRLRGGCRGLGHYRCRLRRTGHRAGHRRTGGRYGCRVVICQDGESGTGQPDANAHFQQHGALALVELQCHGVQCSSARLMTMASSRCPRSAG